jgi:2,4-dienoyl-CoA reductase (NADPH2)
MRRHEPFRYRDAQELLNKAAELGVSLPFQDSIAPLFEAVAIGRRKISNRIAVHPMEGLDGQPSGAPGELTFRRYERYARGGSGLIWFEACSVTASGRSNPRQLRLTRETLSAFQQLLTETRRAATSGLGPAHEPYLVLQLTHSGRFSCRESGSKRRAARFNKNFDRSPEDVDLFSDRELDAIGDQFVSAALLAYEAGFDAVDIKACHGYLIHELLTAVSRRDSRYGGSFENRIRLLMDIVTRVRKALPRLDVAVRMNATDGMPLPSGFDESETGGAEPDYSEALRVHSLLIEAGCVLVNITAGSPYYAPHIGKPFDRPARGGMYPEIHPLRGVSGLIQAAAVFQKACPDVPVVGTGYSWLRQFWPHVGAAVVSQRAASLIGLGRNAFAYPDAPRDLIQSGGLNPSKCCTACSCCTDLMRNYQVTGCVIRDQALYKRAYGNIRK